VGSNWQMGEIKELAAIRDETAIIPDGLLPVSGASLTTSQIDETEIVVGFIYSKLI